MKKYQKRIYRHVRRYEKMIIKAKNTKAQAKIEKIIIKANNTKAQAEIEKMIIKAEPDRVLAVIG